MVFPMTCPTTRRPSTLPLALALAAGLFATTGTAMAEEVASGSGKGIELSPPDGYCVLDENGPNEAAFVETMRKSVDSRLRLAVPFADCHELVELREGKRNILDNFGQILLLVSGDGTVRLFSETRPDFLKAVAKPFPAGTIEDIIANGEAQLTAQGSDAPQPMNAIVRQDEHAVYVATLRMQGDRAGNGLVAGIAGVALIRQASVTVNLFSAYDGDRDKGAEILRTLTERMRIGIEDLYFVNDDVAPTPKPLPVPDSAQWKAMAQSGLIAAAIVGGLGALIGTIIVWRRRRRARLALAGEAALAADSTSSD